MIHPSKIAGAANDPAAQRITQEFEERKKALRTQFDTLYSEWLRLRADAIDPRFVEEEDEEDRCRGDRIDELARLIPSMPAVLPWMIFYKIAVLEHYLGDDGTNWTDNREVVMLAGIKADLLRFEPRENSYE